MLTHLVPIDGGHDERVGAEVGREHLHVLDRLAHRAPPVEVRPRHGPKRGLGSRFSQFEANVMVNS